jgi:hypothetical protein
MKGQRAWLAFALCMFGCQPSTLCDPGQHAINGGCYPDQPKGDASAAPPDAADDRDTGEPSGSCVGDRYDGFKDSCSSASDCGCHAPDCATAPLGYCTKFNCDPSDATTCPPDWTCLMIPPGASPDPTLTHLCLAP